MVYEWGKLPSKGYAEEFPEDTDIHKGELILHEIGFNITVKEAPFDRPIKEATVGESVRNAINKEGQRCTYVRVVTVPFPVPVSDWVIWFYTVKTATYIQKASPLTGLEITAIIIVVCAIIGLAIVVGAPILWKWSGLSPKEVQDYLGAVGWGGLGGVAIIMLALVVVALFILFVWRKK